MRYSLRKPASALCVSTAIAAVIAGPALAQTRSFDLPAQDARTAIPAFAEQANIQLIGNVRDLKGKRTNAVHGALTTEAALQILLDGTGLVVVSDATTGISIVRPAPAASPAPGEADAGVEPAAKDDEIVVTGTRIPGVVPTSPVFSYSVRKAQDQGITDMHGLAASIPQNFNGGQNPGVGSGAESYGSSNGDSSTALNLRGLGPDATLTLLNGHRLAYDSNEQAIDFSAIPLAAVERVEVMPDGASAIYGSDAVGGVVNIILKKDYRGLQTSATVGGATSGGDFTQNYNAVGGIQWRSGGLVLTGNFDRSTEIKSGQRSFTASANPALTVYPFLRSYGFVADGHQELAPGLTFLIDAAYSHRYAYRAVPYNASGPLTDYGLIATSHNHSATVAPSLKWTVSNWALTASAVYGRSHSENDSLLFLPAQFVTRPRISDQTKGTEISAEGPLFMLPAGKVHLAIGGGFRRDTLTSLVGTSDEVGGQSNYYGYGEINVPLFAPQQGVPGLYRLSIDAAFRVEDYPGIGHVALPKVGVVWAPTADLDVKGSWGKSFKAPTLFQRLYQPITYLFPGDYFGYREAPAGQQLVFIDGGNPDLKPERARSFAATIDLHPRAIAGLTASLTYFDINYRNRIVQPITSIVSSLVDPTFAQFITFNPTVDDIDQAIALSPTGLLNETNGSLDPSQVYAIIDGRYRNVSSEKLHGLDIALAYDLGKHGWGDVSLQGDATYLVSERAVVEGASAIDLAGTIFNPPHWRGRGGISWVRGAWAFNAIANYIGSVRDTRYNPVVTVSSMTSFDFSVKRRIGSEQHGLSVQVSALNAFNAKPAIIHGSGINQTYDSTNYSAVGRYLSITLTKAW